MKRSWRMKLPEEKVTAIAVNLVEEHTALIDRGFRLMGSSAVWKTKSDGLTARFVYRHRAPDGEMTKTFVFRGLRSA